jgi:hypothetical protein
MARANEKNELQADMFPVDPIIGGLAITDFKLSGAEIKAALVGVTNVNDVARIDNACWQKAVSDWLIALHLGDLDTAMVNLKRSYVSFVSLNGEPHRETPLDKERWQPA